MISEKTREDRCRRQAAHFGRFGFRVRKDRAHTYSVDHQGGYMVIDADTNGVVAGERFDLSLDELEVFLSA